MKNNQNIISTKYSVQIGLILRMRSVVFKNSHLINFIGRWHFAIRLKKKKQFRSSWRPLIWSSTLSSRKYSATSTLWFSAKSQTLLGSVKNYRQLNVDKFLIHIFCFCIFSLKEDLIFQKRLAKKREFLCDTCRNQREFIHTAQSH